MIRAQNKGITNEPVEEEPSQFQPTKAMLSYLKAKVPEFETINPLSLSCFLSQATLIDLSSSSDFENQNSAIRTQKTHKIDDA